MSSHATAAIASSSDASPPVVASTPGRARLARGRWRRGRVLALLALLAALAVLAPLLLRGTSSTNERYVTEDIGTGPVSQVVGATGALNPVTTVLVGAQVSGTVASRHVDYNSRVKPGDVLLRLEPTLLQAEVDQAAAELADKQALLGVAQANLLRYEGLVARGFVAPLSLDQYRQAVASGTAQVSLAQAKLARARANLGYTTVRSPVAGVVVAREVEVGQTVAANFQTPTLFKIAPDLTRMQIDTNVAEADVGSIQPGAPVSFTVDAYPDRRFTGTVRHVRLNPTIQQNVVTYNVVVDAANPEERLLPGMTAHLKFTIAQRDNALRIPNAALRYTPSAAGRQAATGASVYVLVDGSVAQRAVKTGITDGRYTELLEGDLRAGDRVVIDETERGSESKPSLRMRAF
ncbi:MAG: efflux RND transporter periplasmic adaptor subunit [Pseudomonadota bacterium]|jgi:HlyD family secretion protein